MLSVVIMHNFTFMFDDITSLVSEVQASKRNDLHETLFEPAPVGDGTSDFTSQRCTPSHAIHSLQRKAMKAPGLLFKNASDSLQSPSREAAVLYIKLSW